MSKATLFIRKDQITPRLRININVRMIAAIILTTVLYPIYATVRLWRDANEAVRAVANTIETWYWSLDRVLVQGGQILAVGLIFVVAMAISPVKVMA